MLVWKRKTNASFSIDSYALTGRRGVKRTKEICTYLAIMGAILHKKFELNNFCEIFCKITIVVQISNNMIITCRQF